MLYDADKCGPNDSVPEAVTKLANDSDRIDFFALVFSHEDSLMLVRVEFLAERVDLS